MLSGVLTWLFVATCYELNHRHADHLAVFTEKLRPRSLARALSKLTHSAYRSALSRMLTSPGNWTCVWANVDDVDLSALAAQWLERPKDSSEERDNPPQTEPLPWTNAPSDVHEILCQAHVRFVKTKPFPVSFIFSILVKRHLLCIPLRSARRPIIWVAVDGGEQMVAGGGINWPEGHAGETLRVFSLTVLSPHCALKRTFSFLLCNSHLSRNGGIYCSECCWMLVGHLPHVTFPLCCRFTVLTPWVWACNALCAVASHVYYTSD